MLRCECGFEARADDEDGLVNEVRRHAWDAHGMAMTDTDARQLIRRAHHDEPARHTSEENS